MSWFVPPIVVPAFLALVRLTYLLCGPAMP